MKKQNHISKSIAYLFLTVTLYMHLCSALCAIGSDGLCGKDENDKQSCCKSETDNEGKKHDCQDMHFAFFNATGQFAQAITAITFTPFQSLVAVVTPLLIFIPVAENKNHFGYNGFHPPPPKVDIRIIIQSFQI